jgi:hypothetical protein
MYAAAQAQQAPSEAGSPGPHASENGGSATEDEVVDAEIVDDETSGGRR